MKNMSVERKETILLYSSNTYEDCSLCCLLGNLDSGLSASTGHCLTKMNPQHAQSTGRSNDSRLGPSVLGFSLKRHDYLLGKSLANPLPSFLSDERGPSKPKSGTRAATSVFALVPSFK